VSTARRPRIAVLALLSISACHGKVSATDASAPSADGGFGEPPPVDGGLPDSGIGTRTLSKLTGDGQSGITGTVLAEPLLVLALDVEGRPSRGGAVRWTAVNGAVDPPVSPLAADGSSSTSVTLGAIGTTTVAAVLEGAIGPAPTFTARATGGLVYRDPPRDRGRVQLVLDRTGARRSPYAISLALVTAEPGRAYSVGFDLPVDSAKVRLAGEALTPGSVLPAGSGPAAAKAVLPLSGPLRGRIVAAQSQKAAGRGAVESDSAIPAGGVLFTIHLEAAPGAAEGMIFDGETLGGSLRAGLRNKAGDDVARSSDFAIGRLELR
jgi:hypothetical protein